jgi:predicted permease
MLSAWHRLVALFRRRRLGREIDDELAFHLAMREADRVRDGDADAARAARRQFGNVAVIKEQVRDMWTFPSFESFWQDVRYAFRAMRKSPGFSVVALFVLALGIGANTAMFSLVDAMFLRGLPYPDADRLVVLIGNVQRTVVERRGNSYPDHVDWRAKSQSFADMAAYTTTTVTLMGDGTSSLDEPERVTAEGVSAPYFSVLGVAPAQGRTFTEAEDRVPNRDFVLVLSDGLWRRRFGADPSIVNRQIQLGARSFTVIGIMPPGFNGVSDQAQLWTPFVLSGVPLENRGSRGFQTVARLKPNASIEAAQAELAVISSQLEAAYPATNEKRGVEVTPLRSLTYGSLQQVVTALGAAVTFVLLIACANVANLLVGRSEVRQREIAVRAALGAGRSRLMRQLLTESVVLTALGAAAGLGLAFVAVRALLAASPVTFPTFVRPELNVAVIAFTVAIALVCGVAVGLAPSLHARFGRLSDALKASARGSGGARSHRLRSWLVGAEVALAIVLLVGAGLMIRSVQKLTAIDPGFEASGVLTLTAGVPRLPQTGPAPTPGGPPPPPPPFVVSARELLDRVSAVPGVSAAALASDTPLGPNSSAVFYQAEGDTTTDAQTMPRAYVHRVSPEFFSVLGMPFVAGRTFTGTDADAPLVIVSEGVTRRFWPGQDPIGKRLRAGPNAPWMSIAGVVPDVNYRGLPRNPTPDPDLYLPAVDRSPQNVIVRTSGDPASVATAVRAAIRAHPSIVVYNVATLDSLVDAQSAPSRFTTWMLAVFAGAALLLSVVGIYGVMSYLVTQRTREFGLRLALGAGRGQIVGVVLRQAATMIGIGLVVGVAASAALSRLLGTLLFDVGAADPSAVVAIGVLVVVALLACAVPALRATRVDPMVALRND